MKIDSTSLFVNSGIKKQPGGQAAWGTSFGQEKAKGFPIQLDKEGVAEMLAGIIHNACTNYNGFSFPGMSKKRELITFAIFNKVFVNGCALMGANCILAIVREHSRTSDGKLHLSYAPYFSYDHGATHVSNALLLKQISDFLHCPNGCWFARKIAIRRTDELHIRVVVVSRDHPTLYETHKDRRDCWEELAVIDSFNERTVSVPFSAEGFYRYMTELRPIKISSTKAAAYCKVMNTLFVRNIVSTVVQITDDMFQIKDPEDINAVIRYTASCPENSSIYQGVPQKALMLYKEFSASIK